MWRIAMLKKKFFSWNFIGNCNACSMAIIVDMYALAWTIWTSIGINNIVMLKTNKIINWTNKIDKNTLNGEQLHANGFLFKDEKAIILE